MMIVIAFILNCILCSAFASRCDTFIISNAIIAAAFLIHPNTTNNGHRRR